MTMVMMNITDIKVLELHQEDRHTGREKDDQDRQYRLRPDHRHNRDHQVQIFQIMVEEFGWMTRLPLTQIEHSTKRL